jgi:hypothetical protein
MDRALWQQHLAQTECDVAEVNRHIARQREIVSELEARGDDSQSARDLLALFESLLTQHTAHCERLRTELAE